jgi:hypothetical protein
MNIDLKTFSIVVTFLGIFGTVIYYAIKLFIQLGKFEEKVKGLEERLEKLEENNDEALSSLSEVKVKVQALIKKNF